MDEAYNYIELQNDQAARKNWEQIPLIPRHLVKNDYVYNFHFLRQLTQWIPPPIPMDGTYQGFHQTMVAHMAPIAAELHKTHGKVATWQALQKRVDELYAADKIEVGWPNTLPYLRATVFYVHACDALMFVRNELKKSDKTNKQRVTASASSKRTIENGQKSNSIFGIPMAVTNNATFPGTSMFSTVSGSQGNGKKQPSQTAYHGAHRNTEKRAHHSCVRMEQEKWKKQKK